MLQPHLAQPVRRDPGARFATTCIGLDGAALSSAAVKRRSGAGFAAKRDGLGAIYNTNINAIMRYSTLEPLDRLAMPKVISTCR